MSRQRAAMVRLLFLIISATFLVAIGGGVFAYSIEDTSDAPEGLTTPSPAIDSIQESPENGKPPLIGGIPSEPPPIAAPQSPSLDRTGVDFQSSADAPTITIWHGDVQKAGLKGDPQKWVNITGTVNPKPSTITYSLNGGPAISLRIGPDLRRLENVGDFNVDLDYTDLNPGSNQVIITAKDSQGDSSQAIVTVNYVGGGVTWTTGQTYTYDWSTASRIDDLAQIVDGYWRLDNDVVKPLILGYDRLISIGDMSWQDYTVTVPIKFSGIDPDGYRYPSNGPGVGVIVRWRGHFYDGVFYEDLERDQAERATMSMLGADVPLSPGPSGDADAAGYARPAAAGHCGGRIRTDIAERTRCAVGFCLARLRRSFPGL